MDRGAWWVIVHGVTKESDATVTKHARMHVLGHLKVIFQEHSKY